MLGEEGALPTALVWEIARRRTLISLGNIEASAVFSYDFRSILSLDQKHHHDLLRTYHEPGKRGMQLHFGTATVFLDVWKILQHEKAPSSMVTPFHRGCWWLRYSWQHCIYCGGSMHSARSGLSARTDLQTYCASITPLRQKLVVRQSFRYIDVTTFLQ